MKQHLPFVSVHLFERSPEEFSVGSVDELFPAVCLSHPHYGRTSVGHDAEAIFTLARSFVSVLALRDVFHIDHMTYGGAAVRTYHIDLGPSPDHRSSTVQEALFHFRAPVRQLEKFGELPIVGMDQFLPETAQHFLLGIAQHPAKRRIRLLDPPVQPAHAHTERCVFEDRTEMVLKVHSC